jgi:hypothetical protein
MRRLAISLVVALSMVVGGIIAATPAISHGSCTNTANRPTHSGGTVTFRGKYDCNGTIHTITVTVTGYRRQVGGTWTQVASKTTTAPSVTQVPVIFSGIPWDCRKDYYSKTVGSASPGAHGPTTTNSQILFHTC